MLTKIRAITWPLPLVQAFFILMWSSGAVAIVIALRYINPFAFLFYRIVFAALFMLLVSWLTKAPWPRDRAVIYKTIAAGLLTQFSYLTGYTLALFYGTTPTVMAIILALQPLLTAVICNAMLKHHVSKAQYFGLLVGLAGVIITVAADFSAQSLTATGFVCALVCLCGITVGSVVQKYNPGVDLRTGNAMQFTVSIIPILVLNCFYGSFKLPTNITFILSMIWMVLVISVGVTYLYYKLLQSGSAVKVNSLFYLVPIVTGILCYFAFGQAVTTYIIVGMVLIVAGVLITQRYSPKAVK